MKKAKRKNIIALIILIFFALNVIAFIIPQLFAKASDVTYVNVELNNKLLVSDVSPFISNKRTIVPVRMVFEAIGADVKWLEREQKVEIVSNDTQIDFIIDSKTAYLNKKPIELDVSAQIINSRTFVPLRFLAENCGFKVEWYDETKTVKLYRDEKKYNSLNKIDIGDDRLSIELNDKEIAYNSFILENPQRLVIDIKDCVNNITDFKFNENSFLNAIRYSQFSTEPMISRIVLELKEKTEYKLKVRDNAILVDLFKTDSDKQEDEEKDDKKDETKKSKRVVLDAGHGGHDPGAVGMENGVIVLKEKDVNLKIALLVYDMLKKENVDVYITRKTDKFLELSEIAQFANDLDADFFVSIHNNASENANIRGTMTMYAYDEPKENMKISGKEFANIMQKHLVKATGGKNYGVVKNSNLAVVKRTKMPAVITESLFISNKEDRELLLNEIVINKIARAICDGILEVLEI